MITYYLLTEVDPQMFMLSIYVENKRMSTNKSTSVNNGISLNNAVSGCIIYINKG